MDGHKLPFYRLSGAETLAELRTQENGLPKAEAAERLRHIGRNQLERAHRVPSWLLFVRQFKNLLVLILIVSAAFSLYLHDVKTATIMFVIAFMNAIVGFFQEHKAESLLS